MKTFRIHKTRGTSKIVLVEATTIRFEAGGSVSFWRGKTLTMSYAPWAWKMIYEDSK